MMMQPVLKRSAAKFRKNQRILWSESYWPPCPEEAIEGYGKRGYGVVKDLNWVDTRPDGTPTPIDGWVYLVEEYSLDDRGRKVPGELAWHMENCLYPQTAKKFRLILTETPAGWDRIMQKKEFAVLPFDAALALSEPMRDAIVAWYQESNLTAKSRFNALVKTVARRVECAWQSYRQELPYQLELELELGLDPTQPFICEIYINKAWSREMGVQLEIEDNPDESYVPVSSGWDFAAEILDTLQWAPGSGMDVAVNDTYVEMVFYAEDFSWSKVIANEGAYLGNDDEVSFTFYEHNSYG